MTGWKIGYTIANEKLSKAIQNVHQWVTFAVNTPAQHAAALAFSKLDSYIPEFKSIYQKKRDLIISKLKETKYKYYKQLGSYFILVDYPKDLFKSDIEASTELITKYKLATIPLSVFYTKSDEGKEMLRLCFAKTDEIIIKGIDILKSI